MCAARGPSFEFADGVLRIEVPLAKMRIQWHPKPLAEELTPAGRRWRVFCPEFRLVRPPEPPESEAPDSLAVHPDAASAEAAGRKERAFASFRSEIPEQIVRPVEPFGSYQWALMVLLREQPLAADLLSSNPVLAYALANSDQLRGTRPEAAAVQAQWYCIRKQRKVLEWLGFPGTEAMVRLLRKIVPEHASPSLLRQLKYAIDADKGVTEVLMHLQSINAVVLDLATNPRLRGLVTPKLLQEASTREEGPGDLFAGDMILRSLDILRTVAPRRVVNPFSSIQQVQQFHEEVDAEYQAHLQRIAAARIEAQRAAADLVRRRRAAAGARNREETRRRAEVARRPFPSPPLPGTKDIIPLTSDQELQLEGFEQRHCVGAYVYLVRAGGTYIYRVMAPERATLAITRSAHGCWQRSQLLGKGNRKVGGNTVRLVDAWLSRHSVSV